MKPDKHLQVLVSNFLFVLVLLIPSTFCTTIVINDDKIDTENIASSSNVHSTVQAPEPRQDLSSMMVSGPDAADILQAAFAQAGVDLGGPLAEAPSMIQTTKRPSIASRLRNIRLPSLTSSITSAFNRRKINPLASMMIPVLSPAPGHIYHHPLIAQSKPIKIFGNKFNPNRIFGHQQASAPAPSFVLHPNSFHNPMNDHYITSSANDVQFMHKPSSVIVSQPQVYVQPTTSSPAASGFMSSQQQIVSQDNSHNYQGGQAPSSMSSDQNIKPSNFISLTSNANNGYSSSPSHSASSYSAPSFSPPSPKTSYIVNHNYGDNWTPTSGLSQGGFKPIHESKSNNLYNYNMNTNNGQSSSHNYSSLINTETKRASHSLYESFAKLSSESIPSLATQSKAQSSGQTSVSGSSEYSTASPTSFASLTSSSFHRTYDPWKFNDSIPEESSNDVIKYSLPSSFMPLKSNKDTSPTTESILSGLHKIFPINPSAILEQINKNENLIKSRSSADCQNKHLGWCDFTDNYPTPFVVAVIKECRDVIERMYVEVPQNLADFDDFVPFTPIFNSNNNNNHNNAQNQTSEKSNKSKSRAKAFSSTSLSAKFSEWPSISSYRTARSSSFSSPSSSSSSLCDSDKKFVRPSVAQDITGRWFVVVQSSLYHQQVPVEICRDPGSGCNNLAECGSGARCVQKFNTQLLISIDLDKENDCPSMRLYRFPSGCVCDNASYYK